MIAKFGDTEIECRDGSFDYEMVREIWGDRYYTTGGFDIPQGAVVLDVGGCIGGFTLFAATNGATKIHTYEPTQESYEIMIDNIRRYKGDAEIFTYPYAVTAGEREVKISGFGPTETGLVNTGLPKVGDTGVTVTGCPIVEILEAEPFWDYVKVDIEGYEYEMFDSMSQSDFDKIGIISMEFHGDDEMHAQASGLMLVGRLKSVGFNKVDYKWSYGNQGRIQAKKV